MPGAAPSAPGSCRASRMHPSQSSPKTSLAFSAPPRPHPRLPPLPRTLVRGARPQPCRFGPVRGRGSSHRRRPGPFPLPHCGVAHSPIPIYGHGCRRPLLGGRSPVLEGDQQPGIQDVLLGFPRVISCKGKGRGTRRKKKPGQLCGLQVRNDIRPHSVFMNRKLFSCGLGGGGRVDFFGPDAVPDTPPPQVKINTQGQEERGGVRKMKLAVYFAVVKNFKHVTATCSKATLLTRNPACKAAEWPSHSPPPLPGPKSPRGLQPFSI